MNFVAVTLFTQQVFHLECLLLIQIKSQSGIAYKSVAYKRNHLALLFSPKNGDCHNRGELFKEGGFKPSTHYDIELLKGGML